MRNPALGQPVSQCHKGPLSKGVFEKLSKGWLVLILLFLPFQVTIAQNTIWAVNYLYQGTIVLFLPLALLKLYRGRNISRNLLLVFIPIAALAVSGAISCLINGNRLFITALGIFDYIKNFLVIFIYAAFFTDSAEWKKILNYVIVIGAFLGAVAAVQEAWALIYHYILGYDIYHTGNYILMSLPDKSQGWELKELWRFGFLRETSLMSNPDALGLYSLLILFFYLYTREGLNPLVFFLLFTGVFVSFSRMIFTGFVLLAGLQFFKGRRWIAISAGPVIVLLFLMSSFPDLNITHYVKKDVTEAGHIFKGTSVTKNQAKEEEAIEKQQEAKLEEWAFRPYAKNEALRIWRDNPIFGVGPGMFGGVVSVMFHSPVYKKYGFSPHWYNYMKPFRSLDQFWPQALAELGAAGTVAFAGILLSILIGLFVLGKRAGYEDARGLFAGLAGASLLIFIYTMGSGLNETFFLFTYSAFVGMGLGYENAGQERIKA